MNDDRLPQASADTNKAASHQGDATSGSLAEVFWAFLKLGLTSFGGPIAHLAYLFRKRSSAQAAMRGTNAAVVGILSAALYDPVWTSAVLSPQDFALALAGFLLLTVWKLLPGSPWFAWQRLVHFQHWCDSKTGGVNNFV